MCIIVFFLLFTQAQFTLGTVEPQFYFTVARQPDIPDVSKLNDDLTVERAITLHTIDNTVAVDTLASEQSGVSVPVLFPNQHGFTCQSTDTSALTLSGKYTSGELH